MKNRIIIQNLLVAFLSVVFLNVFAQEKTITDTVSISVNQLLNPEPAKKLKRNTISVNITNPSLISTKFLTVGYERILTSNQSFMVQMGSFSIPRFTQSLSDSLGLNTDYKDKGFHASVDYRFYLKKQNKYSAPRGVYIGPYYAYNYLNREVNWILDGTNFNGNVNTNFKLNIHAIGFQMGYQFVFWDRLSLDLILAGPGLGVYNLKTELNTTLSPDEESEFFDKLNQYLEDHLPGYDKVIDAGEFKRTGNFNTVDVAYRYSMRIGYRF